MLLNLSGCVPGDVKRQARENKEQHEGEFATAVETQLGSDYVLSDVEGCIPALILLPPYLPSFS